MYLPSFDIIPWKKGKSAIQFVPPTQAFFLNIMLVDSINVVPPRTTHTRSDVPPIFDANSEGPSLHVKSCIICVQFTKFECSQVHLSKSECITCTGHTSVPREIAFTLCQALLRRGSTRTQGLSLRPRVKRHNIKLYACHVSSWAIVTILSLSSSTSSRVTSTPKIFLSMSREKPIIIYESLDRHLTSETLIFRSTINTSCKLFQDLPTPSTRQINEVQELQSNLKQS